MADELTENTLNVSAEWRSKTVTTDPPKLVPHEEWRLVVSLSADSPFRLAVLMYLPTEMQWGLRPFGATSFMEVSMDFFPYEWSTDDRVQINFGWQRVTVNDPALKADPRSHVKLLLPVATATGRLIPVCEVRHHGLGVGICAIADQDTERRRLERWRVKPRLANALPADLAPLASGHQSGLVRLHAKGRGAET